MASTASSAPDPQDPRGTAHDPVPPQDSRGGDGQRLDLPRVGPRDWGYRVDEVEALLVPLLGAGSSEGPTVHGEGPGDDDRLPEPQSLREAVFRRQRGGYAPAGVDAAIDRLEDRAAGALARRRIRENGSQSWDDHVDRQLELIMGRLQRPAGHRFRAPSSLSARGYSAPEVDELCERLLEQLQRHDAPPAEQIRAAVFGAAHGQDVYEEHQVDAFLDAVVELLISLD